MNEISCEMCLDLMPLVRDGVASEESCRAVQAHMAQCPDCRAVYESGAPENTGEKALAKTMKRIKIMWYVLTGGLLLLGIILCESVMQGSSMVFCLVAWIISRLLKVTFRLEKGGFLKRIAALAAAVFLIWGVLWAGNEVFGNPVTKLQAEHHIRGYLEAAFADTDYYLDSVSYNWSRSYDGYIHSASDPEMEFYIAYRDGKIIYDTYKEHVLDIWE